MGIQKQSIKHSTPLNVPLPTRSQLSFCATNTDALAQWARQLPMAHIGETARRLYQALQELNELKVGPGQRYQLLETLRSPVYYICAALSRHHLGQSAAPEKQEQIAELIQTLQNHLATGYKLVIEHTLRYKDQLPTRAVLKLSAGAIHRAITELSQAVLRSCQHYCAPPDRVWLELHWLFRLACHLKLAELRLQDNERQYRPQASITDLYKQILMLACARPNQLRQKDLTIVYSSLELWCDQVELVAADHEDALFVFDQQRDAPPTYRMLSDAPPAASLRGIKCDTLVNSLGQAAQAPEHDSPSSLSIPEAITTALLHHLSFAWSRPAKRSHPRTPAQGTVRICLGLTAAHYFIGGQQPFAKQLTGSHPQTDTASNPFLTPRVQQGTSVNTLGGPIYEDDVWAAAFDADRNPSALPLDDQAHDIDFTAPGELSAQTTAATASTAYSTYELQQVDVSPDGYCLEWRGALPPNVQAGSLIGIKEKDNADWLIGTIRWVRQQAEQVTRMGIQLLAPHAIACGTKVVQKTGSSAEYMRGLLLPEMQVLGLPASLITPSLPFRVGHKVVINQHGKETRYKLSQLLAAPGEFQQFEISPLGQAAAQAQGSQQFDKLWKKL